MVFIVFQSICKVGISPRIKEHIFNKNKEECYSRVPRLTDTRYSAKGIKGKCRYASSKERLKYATYRR